MKFEIYTITKLERELKVATVSMHQWEKDVEDKWQHGFGPEKKCFRLRDLIDWKKAALDCGVKVERGFGTSEGYVRVDGRFIIVLSTLRWRKEGKNKWYHWKEGFTCKDFLSTYVLS